MKIRIDPEICSGHGRCYETAPDLVTDDEAGRGQVRNPDAAIPAEFEEQARNAASVCPERAVILYD